MSSPMQYRPDRRWRAPAILVPLLGALLLVGATDAVASEVDVLAVAASPADRLVSLAVDVRSGEANPLPPESFSVTARGVQQPIQAVPVFSGQLAVGIVVDASAAGRAALPAGVSGAANFVLGQPTARAAVIADTSPPMVLSTLEANPSDVVRALSAVRAAGERQTSQALSLAIRELAAIPARSRLVTMFTTGTGAGERPAEELAAHLLESHTFLAVVSTADDTRYWSEVARLSGGVLVKTSTSGVFEAFDQVAEVLRTRYLLTFPTPGQLPERVSVRVDTAEGPVTVDTVVPAASAAATPGGREPDRRWPLVLALVVFAPVAVLTVLALARRFRPADQRIVS